MSKSTKNVFAEAWFAWCQILGPIENVYLADICEVSNAAVTGWLNGQRKPREAKIIRLANCIRELVRDGKAVIRPHNRNEFSTLCTLYCHQGKLPEATDIYDTFVGLKSVDDALNAKRSKAKSDDSFKINRLTDFVENNLKRIVAVSTVLFFTIGGWILGNYQASKTSNPITGVVTAESGENVYTWTSPKDGGVFVYKPPEKKGKFKSKNTDFVKKG